MTIHERIEEIKARADNATPGPWRAIHGDSYSAYPTVMRQNGPHFILLDASEEDGPNADDGFRYPGTDEDADFIAATRTDVPALCRALEIAVGALEDVGCDYAGQPCGECRNCKAVAQIEAALK